jgi:hypothetical protein
MTLAGSNPKVFAELFMASSKNSPSPLSGGVNSNAMFNQQNNPNKGTKVSDISGDANALNTYAMNLAKKQNKKFKS